MNVELKNVKINKSERYEEGEWRTVTAAYSPEVKQFLVKKYGDDLAEIANEKF